MWGDTEEELGCAVVARADVGDVGLALGEHLGWRRGKGRGRGGGGGRVRVRERAGVGVRVRVRVRVWVGRGARVTVRGSG